jgi:hypothetical protein
MYNETGTTAAIWKSHWKRRKSDYAGAEETEAGAAAVSASGFADGEGAADEAGVEEKDCEQRLNLESDDVNDEGFAIM